MNQINLTIVVPYYNEEKLIPTFLDHHFREIKKLRPIPETIFVNDGSTDHSAEVLRKTIEREKFPNVLMLNHEKNLGMGQAFKTALKKSGQDWIMILPIDNPLEIEEYKKYFAQTNEASIIIGIREDNENRSLLSNILSRLYNKFFMRFLFGIKFKDVNWIPLYQKKVFNQIAFTNNRIFFLPEIIIRALQLKFKIKTVNTTMKKRKYGKATSTKPSTIVRTGFTMISFWFKINFLEKKIL